MSLSNLIWWPWFGKGTEEPPTEEELFVGGIRLYRQGPRVKPRETEDEDELFAVVLLSSEV